MVRAALLAFVTLVVAPQTMLYKASPGEPRAVEGSYTYDFEISGPDTLVRQLVASNPVLSVSEVRATRKGQLTSRSVAGNSNHLTLRFDTAQVTGVASGKPFKFDFQRSSPPASFDPKSDPPRVVSWGLAMGRRNFVIGPAGDYTLADPKEDADAEATGIMLDAIVRLPQRNLTVGETWTTNWTGKRRQANNDATVTYKQTARLEQLTEGAAPQATISFTTSGVFNIPDAKNVQGESTSLEAKGTIVLDVATGVVLASDSSGAISTELKKAGVKMVRRITARMKVS